jgi:hypothetical protein
MSIHGRISYRRDAQLSTKIFFRLRLHSRVRRPKNYRNGATSKSTFAMRIAVDKNRHDQTAENFLNRARREAAIFGVGRAVVGPFMARGNLLKNQLEISHLNARFKMARKSGSDGG